MFGKNKKIDMLNHAIQVLIKKLEEGNFVELSYILGNKKEIIKRNLMAGIFRGIGIRNWSYCFNSSTSNFTA